MAAPRAKHDHPNEESVIFEKKPNARIHFTRDIAPVRPQVRRPQRRPRIRTLAVVRHRGGWALMVDELDEPAWIVSTKAKATRSARQAARFHSCRLRVFTTAGKLQTDKDFAAA